MNTMDPTPEQEDALFLFSREILDLISSTKAPAVLIPSTIASVMAIIAHEVGQPERMREVIIQSFDEALEMRKKIAKEG